MCGSSRWKGTKAASKQMRNLDETGLIIVGCRYSQQLTCSEEKCKYQSYLSDMYIAITW